MSSIQSRRFVPRLERLEPRQLLSCTIDMEIAGGGKSAVVNTVGEVVNLNVFAVITGNNSDGSDDGFQSTVGSFISSSSSSGSVLGNLSSRVVAPFNASGSQNGTHADLDGDTDLDVGSNAPSSIDGYFNARAGALQFSGGTISGGSQSFLIGTATFTVTSLASGQATNINFHPRPVPAYLYAAIWSQDGAPFNDHTGTLSVGAPVVITTSTTQQSGSVSGLIFKDINGNGKQDTGDTALPGVSVYSDVNNNNQLDAGEPSTTTDSNGHYTLANLAAGNLLIRQILPSGYTQTAPTFNMAQHVTLSAGQNSGGWNFADRPPTTTSPGSISGNVYNDLNGSRTREAGEGNMSGVKVYLDKNKNNVLDTGEPTATTDANGNYMFSNLASNTTYRVREVVPAGFRVSAPFSMTAANWFYDISVGSGANVTAKPFANTQCVLITGNVFNDINSNGVQNTGENGLSGWRVYMDLNNNGSYQTTENSKLTDSSGNFTFMSLKAGTYLVRVVPVSGYTEKAPASHVYKVTLGNGGIWSTKLIFAEHKG